MNNSPHVLFARWIQCEKCGISLSLQLTWSTGALSVAKINCDDVKPKAFILLTKHRRMAMEWILEKNSKEWRPMWKSDCIKKLKDRLATPACGKLRDLIVVTRFSVEGAGWGKSTLIWSAPSAIIFQHKELLPTVGKLVERSRNPCLIYMTSSESYQYCIPSKLFSRYAEKRKEAIFNG